MNEQKILMTQGLPGSGKSTWAKEMLKRFPGEYKRVNRDELRLMVDDGKWSRQNEKTIVDLEERLIVQALASGFSVIIDDTNMASKTVARWRQVASQAGVALETQDFTQVPLATCIAWDLRRANSVGAGVIRRMYEQYIFEEIIPVEHDAGKQDVVMCDIDGTLAKHNRSPHDYAKLGTDSLIAPIKEALLRLRHVREGEELPVIIMSGRPADYRAETKEWLTRHEIPLPGGCTCGPVRTFVRIAWSREKCSVTACCPTTTCCGYWTIVIAWWRCGDAWV